MNKLTQIRLLPDVFFVHRLSKSIQLLINSPHDNIIMELFSGYLTMPCIVQKRSKILGQKDIKQPVC